MAFAAAKAAMAAAKSNPQFAQQAMGALNNPQAQAGLAKAMDFAKNNPQLAQQAQGFLGKAADFANTNPQQAAAPGINDFIDAAARRGMPPPPLGQATGRDPVDDYAKLKQSGMEDKEAREIAGIPPKTMGGKRKKTLKGGRKRKSKKKTLRRRK